MLRNYKQQIGNICALGLKFRVGPDNRENPYCTLYTNLFNDIHLVQVYRTFFFPETIQSPTPPKEPENSTTTTKEEVSEQKEIIENSPDVKQSNLVDSLEETGPNTNSSTEESKKRLRRSMKKKERELAEDRRRSRSRKKQVTNPLSAECFLVSRGWQLDQTRLLRSLDRIQRAHFGRVQLATTINRCVESIRPHLDAVVIHVGNQELIEAAHR